MQSGTADLVVIEHIIDPLPGPTEMAAQGLAGVVHNRGGPLLQWHLVGRRSECILSMI